MVLPKVIGWPIFAAVFVEIIWGRLQGIGNRSVGYLPTQANVLELHAMLERQNSRSVTCDSVKEVLSYRYTARYLLHAF
jgi:hypothetical protein